MTVKPTTFPTPYFFYDLDRIVKNIEAYQQITDSNVRILYATMANVRPEILKAVRKTGIGVFVNSLSHLQTALKVGIKPQKIVFAGSGHDDLLLTTISVSGVHYHADSLNQLEKYLSLSPKGSVGLRVNIGSLLNNHQIDPAPRLGMSLEEIEIALQRFSGLIKTLHVYVGTNLLDARMHCDCLTSLLTLAQKHTDITDIDLGGGFAFAPGDERDQGMWKEVMEIWQALTVGRDCLRLTIEPGRSIVRTAGQFFVTVTDIKRRNGHLYAVVDSSGTWFPRKIVHDINEEIVTVLGKEDLQESIETHICGSTTFSQDFLSISKLPELVVGDIICFSAAGAYNESMHLDFLGMPEPGIVTKEMDRLNIIREAGIQNTSE